MTNNNEARLNETRINEHDVKLARIETLLESVANSMGKMSNAIESQQEALNKLSRVEESFKGSTIRIHDRISALEKNCARTETRVDEIERSTELARVLSKYPKILILIFLGITVMLLPEIYQSFNMNK
jgi:type II secretory pathway component PulF